MSYIKVVAPWWQQQQQWKLSDCKDQKEESISPCYLIKDKKQSKFK